MTTTSLRKDSRFWFANDHKTRLGFLRHASLPRQERTVPDDPPEVVAATEGHAHADFGYHLGIMTTDQLDEVDWLVGEQGVASFKYYMVYKGLNLTSDSTRGTDYTMSNSYDLGHLYRLMSRVAAASRTYGERGRVSLSLHCERAELLRVFIDEARRVGATGLEAYHKARPPLTEQLSIAEALVLTEATRCPVNLLHLSSAEAMTAGSEGRRQHPHLDITLETTLHHLALTYETAGGAIGKVNPPIRTDADREALWQAMLDDRIDTVVSGHACCAEEEKQAEFGLFAQSEAGDRAGHRRGRGVSPGARAFK